MIMCDFHVSSAELLAEHDIAPAALAAMLNEANTSFGNRLKTCAEGLYIPEEMRPLTRQIARAFDAYDLSKAGHSSAI